MRGLVVRILLREGVDEDEHAGLEGDSGASRRVCFPRQTRSRRFDAIEANAGPYFGVEKKILRTIRQIASEERTGILTCQEREVTRHLVFKEGALSSARSSDDDERLGEVLVRRGSITQQHLEDATLFARKGKRLGEVLIEFKIVEPDEMEALVRSQIVEVAANAVVGHSEKLAFTNTKDVIQVVDNPVPVLDVIMEASRRTPSIDDDLKVLMADDRHLSLTKESTLLLSTVEMKPHEAFILTRVTGYEPTRRVFDTSPLPEEQTARAVLGHLSVGILELKEVVETDVPA